MEKDLVTKIEPFEEDFYNYIFFKRFYFGDKIFLNHVADFLQLHLLQEVLFRILERVIHRFGN